MPSSTSTSPSISKSQSLLKRSSSSLSSNSSSSLTTAKSDLTRENSLEKPPQPDPERFLSTGLLVWSHRFSDLSSSLKMVDNYLVKYDPETDLIFDGELILPADFCDFIFPILIGYPNELPIDPQWIKKNINRLMNPGCYLICARSQSTNCWSSSETSIRLGVYRTELTTNLTRLDANLLFVMQSACKNDINLNVTQYVDFIDDLDSVRDHFFPHRLSQNMAQVMARSSQSTNRMAIRARTHLQKLVDVLGREPSEESLQNRSSSLEDNNVRNNNNNNNNNQNNKIRRMLKRHEDLVQIYVEKLLPQLYKVKETFVTEKPKDDRNFYSERFNFFLSKDSFAIILDQNCAFDRLQRKILRESEEKPGPFVRLIRSGAYVAIEGTPRYCNLKNAHHTFYTRSIFLCRLTSFPMVILQEGVKCFDAYYNNDGLDFTYFDSLPINDLLYIDWYQIQIDLKMDTEPRIFKGHVMFWNEMNDILPTLPFTQMKFDPDMAAKIQMLCMEEEESRPYRPLIIFTLQQVLYTYYDPLRARLEILWNLYFRIDDSDIDRLSAVRKLDIFANGVYFYMKSFNCTYLWTQKNADTMVQEDRNCEITVSSVDVTDMDLAKIGWSHQMFEQFLNLYLGRLYPYQNSIKQWLLDETRRIKRQLIVRPTTLTDKLLYRNGFFQTKIEQFQKEQAQKPRKSILNMPETMTIKSLLKNKSKIMRKKIALPLKKQSKLMTKMVETSKIETSTKKEPSTKSTSTSSTSTTTNTTATTTTTATIKKQPETKSQK
ncbi:uncharacterized protein LOC113789163 isoform X2 [Dermatophagoides pteronyssinus]|uniref:uncharacterized protein LOC113789163 isoform X2 n=1 Tax=Dermatophagoides pteronyssinus TaxID=6956 RepID=UPI003F66EF50